MEVGQRPRTALEPDLEQLVVDVLGFDRRQPQALDRRFGQDTPDEPGQRQLGIPMPAPERAIRSAAVVRADVDPGQDDLPMAELERPRDVGQDLVGRQ